MDITKTLEAMPHLHLDLRDEENDECHRPDISVWPDGGDDGDGSVTLCLSALFGQPLRFADMTPDEARKLAKLLTDTATAIDKARSNYEPPDPPGFEAGFAENH